MRMLHPILFRFHPIMPCIYLASGYQHMVIVVASENSNHKGKSFWNYFFFLILLQCNLDLVTLWVSAKTVSKSNNVTKSNDFK